MKPRVKVAFLDHHDVSRRGIVAILEQAVSEVQITHSLTSRMELEQQLCEAAWDVLLMDDMFPKAGDISCEPCSTSESRYGRDRPQSSIAAGVSASAVLRRRARLYSSFPS